MARKTNSMDTSIEADAKLRKALQARGKARPSDAEIGRIAAESQHHSLAWLTEVTGAALR